MVKRGLFLVVALFAAASALASVSVADRSPFTQGHWWNPSRSGSGLDIIAVNGTVMAIWFTYDDKGKPIWYTAVGSQATMGSQAWPLMHHTWVSGRKVDPTAVGSLKLTVRSPESMDADFQVGGNTGTWRLQPFQLSGVQDEVDHTGSWFDATNSGWGISMTEQGDVLGGALFTYDPSGNPTWVAGFSPGGLANGVDYFHAEGACPYCAYTATTYTGVGRMSFDFRGDANLTVHNRLALLMAPGVNVDGANMVQLSRPASGRPADRQLAAFTGDAALKEFLDAGMQNVVYSSGGGADFSAAPPSASVAFSTTNLQEEGVDEADLVKSDGRYLYTHAYTALGTRLPVLRIAEVGDGGATLAARGTVALSSGPNTPVAAAGLYLSNGTLVSVASTQALGYPNAAWLATTGWANGITNVEVFDVANGAAPVTRWRAQFEGHMVSSRRVGNRLYLVLRYVPFLQGFSYGTTYPPNVASNQLILASTPLAQMLPKVRVNDGPAAPAVDAASTYLPPQGEQPAMASMMLVFAIDLTAPRIAQSLAIVGTVDTIYASPTNLYLATSRYNLRNLSGAILATEPAFYVTDLHQVRLGVDTMTLTGTGAAEGYLGTDMDKMAFRLGEYGGRIRAVTSSNVMWGTVVKNRLTILEPSSVAPGLLKTVSVLPNARRPDALGKPGEILYGTRFVADRLYAVTFKLIDPLFVVDLSDSADPRIAGQVTLPGFSDYLHPLANGLLLGFGKDARPAAGVGDGQFAWYQGLQIALFDVSNTASPRQMQAITIGKRGSDSALLHDHHAFAMLSAVAGSSEIGIPARVHDGVVANATDSTPYPWAESGLLRFALRGTTPADARLDTLPMLVTHGVSQGYNPNTDGSAAESRSVLFTNGTIYVGRGQFWRQDTGGNTFGPY